MPRDSQRLDQRANLQRQRLGQGKDVSGVHAHGIAEAASTAAEPDEAARVADVLYVRVAGGAGPAEDGRLDGAGLTEGEARDAGADLGDDAGELVAEGDGDGFAGDGVGLSRAEVGPAKVLVEVCAADADEGGTDLGRSILLHRTVGGDGLP